LPVIAKIKVVYFFEIQVPHALINHVLLQAYSAAVELWSYQEFIAQKWCNTKSTVINNSEAYVTPATFTSC